MSQTFNVPYCRGHGHERPTAVRPDGAATVLTGNGLFAFFDAPWFPIYLIVMFLFHPLFGIAGVLSAVIAIGLTFMNNAATDMPLKEANNIASKANARFQSSLKNAEVVAAMGMSEQIEKRHAELFDEVIDKQSRASRSAAAFNGISKSFRMIAQSLILGLGAYLALNQEISPGMMIAGSLLLGGLWLRLICLLELGSTYQLPKRNITDCRSCSTTYRKTPSGCLFRAQRAICAPSKLLWFRRARATL